MEQNLLYLIIGLLLLFVAYLIGRAHGGYYSSTGEDIPTDLIEIYRQVQTLPSKILQTIQGSINPQKGKMAELLTYAELRYDYDRIIPLGWPIDFIGIKNGDRVDFIEVKSGNSALTEEEIHIKNLIIKGQVFFRLIKVTEDEIERFVHSHQKDNQIPLGQR